MWSSGEDTNRKVSSSSSKSSSTSSCPSPFSSTSLLPTPTRKTMEEVWKDISLTSLHVRPTREDGPKSSSTFKGMILQDFLARPFKEPSTNAVINSPGIDIGLFGSSSPAAPPPGPPTVLSLNSSPEFPYLDTLGFHNPPRDSNHPIRSQSHQCYPNAAASFVTDTPKAPFDAFGSSSGIPSFCKKRLPESEDNSGDRRHKRMIKNRESAARSRARKQAYTNELELEVAHLMEENAKLRKQQQQATTVRKAKEIVIGYWVLYA
ncbi:protein FD-like isoform X2 [Magnolia sinica]|uniref:protein FD-like isoform X2 n=1 Tax=Magnolia sinica TaxID=86752 RepID=UPI00265A016A|nr:protein FD-like isoform X2 [Magnolia sinica]